MSHHCHMPSSYENYLRTIEMISNNFHKCVRQNQTSYSKTRRSDEELEPKRPCCSLSGMYLFHLYLLIKIFYLANIFIQIYAMKVFLGFKDYIFGIQLLKDIITGNQWMESGNFPRVTFCDISTVKFGGHSM